LSSIRFHKAGLRVYGVDGSKEILQTCASKGFTADLKQHDLRDLPLPYPSHTFDHIVCVAVLNSFQDLGPLFTEVSRIIHEQGIFAFTVEDQHPGEADRYDINRVEVDEQPKAETAVTLFRHHKDAVCALLDRLGFTLLKTLEFQAFEYPAESKNVYFKAYVAQKK